MRPADGEHPQLDPSELEKPIAGLVCLDGGPQSMLFKALNEEDRSLATQLAREAGRWFPAGYFLELQDTGDSKCRLGWEPLARFAAAQGIRLVATCDVRYLKPTDRGASEILQEIEHHPQDGAVPPPGVHLLAEWEVSTRFAGYSSAVHASHELAQMVEEYDILPRLRPIHSRSNNVEFDRFSERCVEQVAFRWNSRRVNEMRTAVRAELAAIKKRELVETYLEVGRLFHWAKEENVWLAASKSATASVIAQTLGWSPQDMGSEAASLVQFAEVHGKTGTAFPLQCRRADRQRILDWLATTYGSARVAVELRSHPRTQRMAVRELAMAREFHPRRVDAMVQSLLPREIARRYPKPLLSKEEQKCVADALRLPVLPRYVGVGRSTLIYSAAVGQGYVFSSIGPDRLPIVASNSADQNPEFDRGIIMRLTSCDRLQRDVRRTTRGTQSGDVASRMTLPAESATDAGEQSIRVLI